MTDKEDDSEIKKCIHIAVSSVGAEVLITSHNKNESIKYLIEEAERLTDKYCKRR